MINDPDPIDPREIFNYLIIRGVQSWISRPIWTWIGRGFRFSKTKSALVDLGWISAGQAATFGKVSRTLKYAQRDLHAVLFTVRRDLVLVYCLRVPARYTFGIGRIIVVDFRFQEGFDKVELQI